MRSFDPVRWLVVACALMSAAGGLHAVVVAQTRFVPAARFRNGELPLISVIGRVVTPGVSMSISRNEMPSCFAPELSVRTRQNIMSALSANVVHTLAPSTM